MKKLIITVFIAFQAINSFAQHNWQANWITEQSAENAVNTWYCFRKDFTLENVPQSALAKIAIDSKYWLWINGTMVVFEGGLKRGPSPEDTYYDEVEIAKYLTQGVNSISVLGWYFGKDGFSHKSSGKFGFLFECIAPEINVISDGSWKVKKHPSYETCPPPFPNFRLPESSLKFDARKDLGSWYSNKYNTSSWSDALAVGKPPMAPWNNLVRREIPQWKDSKLMAYVKAPQFPFQTDKDTTIICTLPSNLQITPYLKIETEDSGKTVEIKTENFRGGGKVNVYSQYICRNGVQEL